MSRIGGMGGRPGAALAVALMAAGCIVSRGVEVRPLRATGADSVRVASAVKVHLVDGGAVLFRNGVTIARDSVRGKGERFDAALAPAGSVSLLPLAQVAAMESFVDRVNPGRTLAYSTLATAGAVLGGVGLACAADPKCFGSCPTVYSDSAGTLVLEAEGFSASVSPLLEARDVDRLRARPDSTGRVTLDVWNEALETHYINHLELLEVGHARNELAIPDQRGRALVLGGVAPLTSANDRAGRDVRNVLSEVDGSVFSTDTAILASASADDHLDHIDVTATVPRGGDSVAVVFRLRSSLLNTIAFYDFMLARPGARALDWMAQELTRLDRVAELGLWYQEHFGLRVSVRDGDGWREVARLSDFGPIAWRDVAIVVPASAAGPLQLRVSFLADQFRIDQLRIAGLVRRSEVRVIPIATVTDRDGKPAPEVVADLTAADERYLVTGPRERFTATFATGRPASEARTFFLVSQGWYSEWVRSSWLTSGHDASVFSPTRVALDNVLRAWGTQRTQMEANFHRSRIPVY